MRQRRCGMLVVKYTPLVYRRVYPAAKIAKRVSFMVIDGINKRPVSQRKGVKCGLAKN